jgi:hypothetical protein
LCGPKPKTLWPMVRPKTLSSLGVESAVPCIASETPRGFSGRAFTLPNCRGLSEQYIHYLCESQ